MSDHKSEFSTDGNVDLKDVVKTLWQSRLSIFGLSLAAALVAAAIVLWITPTYRAEALVQIQDPNKSGLGAGASSIGEFGALADLAGLATGGSGDRGKVLATLQSRRVIEKFVVDNKLLPVLFESKWDAEQNRWKTDDPKKIPAPWNAHELITEDILKVTEDRKTGVVTVAVEWKDPDVAAQWVTELIARTNETLRQRTLEESAKNLAYLDKQAQQIGVAAVQKSIYSLIESEQKKLMLANGGEEFALKTIDPAEAPKRKARPQRTLIVILSGIAGFFLSCFWVLVKNSYEDDERRGGTFSLGNRCI